ncbi:M23 family peptidase [Bradyrhizobium sp. HKCCYLS1011]|uniref:M23 family peptidase n=1 Tax=Bradyrhizobium sp. HKCCYLS1011 TaxID=3420733 RepID=UPI003EC13743
MVQVLGGKTFAGRIFGVRIFDLVAILLGLPALAVDTSRLLAQEFRTPAVIVSRADWRAAMDQLRSELNTAPAVAADFSPFGRRHGLSSSDPRARPALLELNGATSPIFTGIGRSPVPVLLPFDTAGYLGARRSGLADGTSLTRYQADFRTDLFDAGPAGYDAVFSLPPDVGAGLPSRIFAKPVEVQITGSRLVYDISDPQGGKGEPVKALAQYPDLRRFIREGYVRYAFTRFGIAYVVSIQCLDSAPRPRRLACREAYPVAERFLKALRVVGGLPAPSRPDVAPLAITRPTNLSAEFTYRPPGDVLPPNGARGQSGRADRTVYSQIRFPLDAPAYVHSQSSGKGRSGDAADLRLGQFPWRDNFCEPRSFNVGQCASGSGHQGDDIRPGACPARREGADGCDPKRQRVLAVRDGTVIRTAKEQAATLQVNSGTEHVRFRYMHMNPAVMDADGLLNGRKLGEGEQIGVVSNYLDHPNGTSRHLHFDLQVFTRDGWIWVSPYVTLVSAYERLIGGRGREIGPQMALSPALTAAPLEPDQTAGVPSGRN